MNADHIDSYYTRTSIETGVYPALDRDIEVEVVVVGGGLAGITTALELAERGQSVALVEAQTVGWGASGRNGGFASEGFPGGFASLMRKVGLEKARRYQALSRLGLDLVQKRIEDYRIECGPLQKGALRCNLASGGEDLKAARDFLHTNFGLNYEYWPEGKVRECLSTPLYSDALFIESTVSVHPLNLTKGLARAAATRGARIFENTPALKIREKGGRKVVVTPNGEIRAQHVVIGGGGYVHGLSFPLSMGTVPIASFVIATEPLGALLEEAIRVPYAIFDNTVAVNYYRALSDTRILWGGRVLAWEPSRVRIAERLKRDMVKFYPALQEARIDTAWGGMMPFTRRKLPVIGQVSPGVWYMTGFGGLGVTLTSTFGHLVAGAIAEGDDRWRLYEEFGLPFAGGKLGKVPAQLIYWTHQARTALGWPSSH